MRNVLFLIIGSFIIASTVGCAVDSGANISGVTETNEDNSVVESIEKTEELAPEMYQCPDNCQNGIAFMDSGECVKCGKSMVAI